MHLQIITNDKAYHVPYDYSEFYADPKQFFIKVGNNIFSENGITIHVETEKLFCHAQMKYDWLTPVQYDMMGIFRYVPFMECNHGVISMHHEIDGQVQLNEQHLDFHGGIGYIEKDWGTSFPKQYLWIQSNDFEKQKSCVMASVATIPFLGSQFLGCICCIYHKNKEYRLATYLGVHVTNCSERSLRLKQGKYQLEISVDDFYPQKLLAPNLGDMSRTIHENTTCQARFYLKNGTETIFDMIGKNTGFEYVMGKS